VRVLLDSCSFLWLSVGDRKRLSETAVEIYEDPESVLFLSMASVWELCIKWSIGKLELETDPVAFVNEQLEENSIDILGIELEHLRALTHLPFHHKDPFDRLILAQAIQESLPVMSADRRFEAYAVQVVW